MSSSDEIPVPRPAEGPRAFGLPGTLAQRWNALAVAACGATVLVMGYRHRWTNDDALIYTRTVRQILAGNGPVYNVGERAETSTGTLWQWLLAAGSTLPGVDDPLRLAVVLGLLFTVAGFLLALDGTRRMIRLRRPAGALLPVGVLVLLPLCATWDYATSGLETGLSLGYLGGCWWLLVRARAALDRAAAPPRASSAATPAQALTAPAPGPALTATAFALGLGPLVRPDLALVGVVFLAALWLMWRPPLRTTLGWAGAAAALPLGYEIFRAGYYGVLVPLPAIAKEASGTQWGYGWTYLVNTLVPYALWVPLGLLAAFGLREVVRRTAGRPVRPVRTADAALVAAPVVAGLLSALFVVKVGGDFMHGRMVLPALFLVLLPVFLLPYGRTAAALASGVGIWGLVCLLALRPPLESPDDGRIIFDSHTVYQQALGAQHPVSQHDHLAAPRDFTQVTRRTVRRGTHALVLRLPRDAGFPRVRLAPRVEAPVAAAEARLGLAGAALPLDGHVVDLLGLGNPLGAHTEPVTHTKAGHEKPLDRAWVLADLTAPGTPVPDGVDPRHVAAARHALTCGPVPELLASVRAPLTPGRFWTNLTGAWSRTHLRLPPNPMEAERHLC
ncbi:hypothetical protein [Streptomyces spirodelae]|uniref:Terminal beta-(1->2)-arabinofuranosyltransferase C-terminal domain-containing protein n=1 Tax=Streptomyces spirodelae TaxID=2812904 RepID=A0ABS3WNK9_9ACTN|nr:hypothetical protein [Streptomyces spirodelae]MBO8184708.1 hypothetical protein [Streptomyces spirodelae]